MNLLTLVNDKAESARALELSAAIASRIPGEWTIAFVRRGTPAAEPPPPLGEDLSVADRTGLPQGIRILLGAADRLRQAGRLSPFSGIRLRDAAHGVSFHLERTAGGQVTFVERFGDLVEELNHEIEEQAIDLVVCAAPRRGALGRFAPLNTPRRFALDLHASFLVARRGGLASRIIVCADGSPSSHRIFPFLEKMLPALEGPIELLCAHRPDSPPEEHRRAQRCLNAAAAWLARAGRKAAISRPVGPRRYRVILDAAGADALLVLGESGKHDVHRRTIGTLPMRILPRTEASVLIVKQPAAPDPDWFEEECGAEAP